jgi:uncharacterized protein YndB with AHSA1/START domain
MKNFKKHYLLPAQPEEVYSALTNSIALKLWTGEEAEMSTEPGSEFSLWEGSISGKNIEFVENHKIVQEWYFGEQDEKSIVTIKVHPDKKGTSMEVIHVNIPDDDFDDIIDGWDNIYYESLLHFFKE